MQTPTVFCLGGGTISFQLLNVRGISDIRQTEIHAAVPLVPEPSAFEVEMAIEKLKILTELFKSERVEQLDMRSINLLFLFGIRKNCLRNGRSQTYD